MVRITIHSQYCFTLVTLTEVKKNILYLFQECLLRNSAVCYAWRNTHSIFETTEHRAHTVNENQLGEAVLEERSTRSEQRVAGIAYFRRLTVNLASPWYPLQKDHGIIELYFEVLPEKNKPCGKHKFMILTGFVQQDKLRHIFDFQSVSYSLKVKCYC